MLDGWYSETIFLIVKIFANEMGVISDDIAGFYQFDNVAWFCSYILLVFIMCWIYKMECNSITWICSKAGLN